MSETESPNPFGLPIIIGIVGVVIGLIAGVVIGVLIGSLLAEDPAEAEEYRQHFKVEILEFEKRGDQVYLKFRNNGDKPIDDMYFEIEVRGKDGKLKEEYEVNYAKWVEAGETEETMLKPFDLQLEPVDLDGEVSVEYKYGWRTLVEE